MAEGNRKDPRARVLNMTVRYKSATVDEFIENHSHDISRGGIFIKTRSPFPAGTLLKFEVRIAEDQKLMHGVGRVVWRREADRAEESFPAGMGIKFIKTGEGASDLINQLIAAREGVESSFDAGVRENVSAPNGGRHSAIPTAPAAPMAAAKPSATAPPTSAPSLSVESAPRGVVVPPDAETAVTNPAKKRQDQAPEKRKVVLQGPALESPPSKRKPSAVTARPAGDSAPSRKLGRGSIAEETTAPRVRHPAKKNENESPKLGGLIVILALVGLVVFVVNRLRGPGAEPSPTAVSAEPPSASPPAALPPPPATEPPPAAQTAPGEANPADPNGAGVEEPAGAEPAPTGAAADPPVAAPGTPPTGISPASPPSQPTPPSPAAAAGESQPPPRPVAPTEPVPPPPAAAKAPAAPAPSTPPEAPKATAPKAAAPAPARAVPEPVPPKPRATAPKPPAPQPPVAKPAEPAPKPPATNGSGGETAGTAPSAKKPAPVQPAPPPPPPAPAPSVPSNDNPY
jgi:uncharacterized protein (TIGR02266 family)